MPAAKKITIVVFLLFAESFADLASTVKSRKRAGRNAEAVNETYGPPNIVFMLMDDWGYHDFGLRDSNIPTPNIDKLASEGIIMNNFYVTPVCSPSRAAFMTGRMPWRWGGANFKPNVDFPYVVPLDEVFFPEVLAKSNQYRVAMVGKWDLGVATKDLLPSARGFDNFMLENEPMQVWGGGVNQLNYAITSLNMTLESGFQGYFLSSFGLATKNQTGDAIWDIHDGVPCAPDKVGCEHDEAAWKSAFDIPWSNNSGLWSVPMDPYNLQTNHSSYSSDTFARSALKVIEKHTQIEDDKALFLFVSFTAPHMPVVAPDEYVLNTKCKDYPVPNEFYKGSQIEEANKRVSCPAEDYVLGYNYPRTFCKDAAWQRYSQCGQFYGLDLAVGSIVSALEEAGMWENTVLWMSGDNGGDLPDASSNYPYWGGKTTAFEGGIKVPGIWSGGLLKRELKTYGTAPYESSSLMLLTDVSATLLALAGLNSKEELGDWKTGGDSDGVDQWMALVNPGQVQPSRKSAVVVSGTQVLGDVKAAVLHDENGRRWKLMHNPGGWYATGVHIVLYQCAIQYGHNCTAMPACIVETAKLLAGNMGKTGSDDSSDKESDAEEAHNYANDMSIPRFSDKRFWSKLWDSNFLERFLDKHFEGCAQFEAIFEAANVMYEDGSKEALDLVIEKTGRMLEWITPLINLIDEWWLFDLDSCEDEGGLQCHEAGREGAKCECNKYCSNRIGCPRHIWKVQRELQGLLKQAEEQTNMTNDWYSPVSDVWGDYTQLGWFVNPWRDSNFNAVLCNITDFRTGTNSLNRMCK